MRILVTGWAGYIGPIVLKRLNRYETVGLDVAWYLRDYAGSPFYPHLAYFDDIRTATVPGPFDVVVHMAGLSNDPLGELAPEMTCSINTRGTVRVIERYPDAHHVVISSCSVYGHADMATEDTPERPLTAYARSKADVDAYLRSAGGSWTSLRLGTVYGYSPGHRLDLVVNRMAHDAVTRGSVTVTSDAARPLVHVEDVAAAVEWAVEHRPAGIYNVVGENWQIGELGRAIAKRADVMLYRQSSATDARDYAVSSDKLAAAGFRPSRTVIGSLDDLLRASKRLPDGRCYERLRSEGRTIGNWVPVAA